MAEDFEPSPRASKRRRITTPNEKSSTEQEDSDLTTPKSKLRRPRGTTATSIANSAAKKTSRGNVLSTNDLPNDINDGEVMDDPEDSVRPRSSGRERKKPRRYSTSPQPNRTKTKPTVTVSSNTEEVVSSTKKQKTVKTKGILTPSKSSRSGTRKSVAFDSTDKDIEKKLGFKDIGGSSTKTASPTTKLPGTSRKQREQSLDETLTSKEKQATRVDHREVDQDTAGDDPIFDQILETQQWKAKTSPATNELKALSFDNEPHILSIKNEVLSRLVSSSTWSQNAVPAHLQTQYETINSLLTATITTGESNSLLVLGSRGSGKSHILDSALVTLREKHSNDFHIVRLNGFFQTDDKVALREIWRQLGHEMNLKEDQIESSGSYADTMASLLSLLSHPDEFMDFSTESMYKADDSSNLVSKSILFILDEFDLFTTHPRQTLLYNLFDIAQSRKAPIAVIGCSTRMDVVECLEKRVKSRFSHRWVHLPNAKSLEGFSEVVKNALFVDEEVDLDGKPFARNDVQARRSWNDYIQTTYLQSSLIQDMIKRVFYTSKSIPDVFMALYLSIASLNYPVRAKGKADPQSKMLMHMPPQLGDILVTLPTLHLSLLVAASRLDTIHNLAAINFNLVYDHYTELIARSKLRQTASGAVAVGAGLRKWSADMAREAWEDLGEWSLIVPVTGGSGLAGRDLAVANLAGGEGADVRMWKVDVTLDDLAWAIKCKEEAEGIAAGAVEVMSKWCKEV